MPALPQIMRRAWSLFRQSMAPYSRPAFAACLRRAWHEAKNATVTPISAIRTVMGCSEGITRDELIDQLEVTLRAARAKAALYPELASQPTGALRSIGRLTSVAWGNSNTS